MALRGRPVIYWWDYTSHLAGKCLEVSDEVLESTAGAMRGSSVTPCSAQPSASATQSGVSGGKTGEQVDGRFSSVVHNHNAGY